MVMIKRELYLDKLRRVMDTEEVKVLTGVRRCGKTCLLKSVIDELQENGVRRENIIYISFESAKYNEINNYKNLDKLVFDLTDDIDGKVYLLFDEIQLINGWEKSINAYRVDLDSDIYITGSNSKLLSGELATLLAGRYITINIYPFSYKEILQYKTEENNKKLSKDDERNVFWEYVNYGGFPGLLRYEVFEKDDYLRDIYNSIVLKDIVERNSIKNVDLIERLINYMITNISNPFSSKNIANFINSNVGKTTPQTVINYVNYMSNALLLYKVKREDLIGKNILKTMEKYYVVDSGLYHIFRDENRRDLGNLLENIVYLELIRRGYNVTIGKMYDIEVDFVCKKGDKVFYIQVSETILGTDTRKRELRSLEKIRDNYPKYVLTLDEIKLPTGSIIQKNIMEFLKEE